MPEWMKSKKGASKNMDRLELVNLSEEHFEKAAEIYNYYVENSTATYATETVSVDEFVKYYKIENELTYSYGMLLDGKLVGFCLLKPWNIAKKAYKYTYEATMYIEKEYCNRHLGFEAMTYLEEIAKKNNVLVILGGVCSENTASCKLCEKLGYEKVGHLKGVGYKFDRFMDIIYYEKSFMH